MKLGTETGSLVNHVYAAQGGSLSPEVGMGATILCWTDRYACTVVHIDASGAFDVREDTVTRLDANGISEAQEYAYEPNPNGRTRHFAPVRRGNAKGQVREDGRKDGSYILLGERRHYHDFSF